jgi:hypothetical protein
MPRGKCSRRRTGNSDGLCIVAGTGGPSKSRRAANNIDPLGRHRGDYWDPADRPRRPLGVGQLSLINRFASRVRRVPVGRCGHFIASGAGRLVSQQKGHRDFEELRGLAVEKLVARVRASWAFPLVRYGNVLGEQKPAICPLNRISQLLRTPTSVRLCYST